MESARQSSVQVRQRDGYSNPESVADGEAE